MKPLIWGLLAGLAIASPAIGKADPSAVSDAVCGALALDPSFTNVIRVVETLKADGLTQHQAGDVVADSVGSVCPQFIPLLENFIDTYAPKPRPKLTPAQPNPPLKIRNQVIA